MHSITVNIELAPSKKVPFLQGKVPFVTLEKLIEELPSFKAQTKDSYTS